MKKNIYVALVIAFAAGTMTLAGCASTRTQESASEYSQSAATTARVKAALLKDESVKSLPISVETFRGTVQLAGFVESAQQIERAGAVARSVEGVKRVDNSLKMRNK